MKIFHLAWRSGYSCINLIGAATDGAARAFIKEEGWNRHRLRDANGRDLGIWQTADAAKEVAERRFELGLLPVRKDD